MTIIAFVVLASVGIGFLLLAGVGINRLPDVFCRASATTKAATLGIGCLLIAVAIHFGDGRVTARVAAIIGFLLLTSPVAAHMLARAAYRTGTPLWPGTTLDELSGREQESRQAD
jgi:multicomponent Na+:H+ antiporter subunit G